MSCPWRCRCLACPPASHDGQLRGAFWDSSPESAGWGAHGTNCACVCACAHMYWHLLLALLPEAKAVTTAKVRGNMVRPTRLPGQRPQAPQETPTLGRPRCAGQVQGLCPSSAECLSRAPSPCLVSPSLPLLHSAFVHSSVWPHSAEVACLLSPLQPRHWAFCSRGPSASRAGETVTFLLHSVLTATPKPRPLGPPFRNGRSSWVRPVCPCRAKGPGQDPSLEESHSHA